MGIFEAASCVDRSGGCRILQGLTRDIGQIEQYLSQWEMLEPRGFRTYREAAAIFRLAVQKE